MIHPIIDEFYNQSPSYERSKGYAVSKGLVSNAPGVTQGATTPETERTDGIAAQLSDVVQKVEQVAVV